jgi:predicted dehydrogenase
MTAPGERPRIRLGLIGAGAYFEYAYHARLRDPSCGFDVRAVSRRDDNARAAIAASLGADAAYADWRRLLEDPRLEAVLISTPHHLHEAQVRAALERGLHVLVDKPLCLDGAEAESLARLAAERGRVLTVAYNYHYWSHFQAARRWVAEGGIGAVLSAACLGSARAAGSPVLDPASWMNDPARSGGGSLASGGTHRLEAVLWLSGLAPRAIFALTRGPRPEFDLEASLVVELEGGALASVLNEARGPRWQLDISLYGERGAVFVRDRSLSVVDGDGRPVDIGAAPPETDALADFGDAILAGRTPLCTPEEAYWAVAVVQAAYASAAAGKAISVRPPKLPL